jgi:mRNA interferase RelE/StbE
MNVIITDEALKQVAKLPRPIQTRVLNITERLKNWPEVSGVKQLTGQWSGCWRIRTGDWRVIFEVKNDVVIIRVAHRKDVYGD